MTKKLKVEYAVKSVIGTRAEQQDCVAVYSSGDCCSFAVCDGMGGLNGGAAASKAAADAFCEAVKNRAQNETVPDLLLRCVDITDKAVFSLCNSEGNRLNAGTTVISSVIENGNLFWMSVGDSRLYALRGDEFIRATRDHNYFLTLSEMPDDYVPSKYEISKGDALISFAGMNGIEVFDISNNPVKLYENDRVLLTSDGLYRAVSDEIIKKIISSDESLDKICDRLITECERLSPKVRDNISFVLIRMKGE